MARECVNEYLETVGGQIRWRRARRVLLRELSDHIADQAAAFEAEGRSPEEALAGAVAEMGEPEAVGRELDRLHRPQNRRGLAVTVAALFAAGVLLQLFAAGLMGDAKDVFYFRRQVLGLLLAAGVLTGLWFSDYTLLLRRKWVPAAALLLFSLAPLWGLPFGWPFLSYKLMLYPTLLLPVPYAALVVSLRGRGTRAVLLCGGLALPLPIWAFVAISSTGYLVTLASMLLVLLAAVGLGWFRGKRRWNLLAALGPALTILPLLFLRHLEYAAWRIGAFLGPDLFYERLRMGELPSLFVGSSPELLLAEAAQGLGRWVFWAAAGLIVLFAALLLRRIRALHSRCSGYSARLRPQRRRSGSWNLGAQHRGMAPYQILRSETNGGEKDCPGNAARDGGPAGVSGGREGSGVAGSGMGRGRPVRGGAALGPVRPGDDPPGGGMVWRPVLVRRRRSTGQAGIGAWFVLDWLRRLGPAGEAEGENRAATLWGCVSLAAALAVNNAGIGVAAGVSGIAPGWAALANFLVTLAALPLGRALGDKLAGRLLGKYALPLSGALLVLLGIWEAVG